MKFWLWLHGKSVVEPGTDLWCKQQIAFLYGTHPAKTNCCFTSLLASWFIREKGTQRAVDTISSAPLLP